MSSMIDARPTWIFEVRNAADEKFLLTNDTARMMRDQLIRKHLGDGQQPRPSHARDMLLRKGLLTRVASHCYTVPDGVSLERISVF